MGNDRLEFERAVKLELKQAVLLVRARKPEFSSFTLSSTIRAAQKRPKGFSGYQERLVDLMVSSPSFLSKTNKDMVKKLANSFPGYKPSESLMYVPLYPKSKDKIQSIMRRNELPIQVGAKDTVSSIKKALRAKGDKSKSKRTYDAVIEITDDSVTVGNRAYSIDKSRKHPSIRVESNGRGFLRCDQLEAILQDAD